VSLDTNKQLEAPGKEISTAVLPASAIKMGKLELVMAIVDFRKVGDHENGAFQGPKVTIKRVIITWGNSPTYVVDSKQESKRNIEKK
jgi:hypothetical protein